MNYEKINKRTQYVPVKEERPDILHIAHHCETLAEALLDAVDPEMKPNDIHYVETGLQALEKHYQSLKSHLLETGGQGGTVAQ